MKLLSNSKVAWRNIAISLIDPDFGKQSAQTGENACFRQLSQDLLIFSRAGTRVA